MPRSTKYMLGVLAPYAFAIGLPMAAITYYIGFNPVAIAHGIMSVVSLGAR